MARPKNPKKKVPVGLRFPPDVLALIDKAAKARGWTRQEWVDQVVRRGLIGEGLLPEPGRPNPAPAAARPRREVQPIPKGKQP